MTKEEWLQQLRAAERYKWCGDDQWECCKMVFDLIGGEHHLCGKIKNFGDGIQYSCRNSQLSTYDFNTMTTMVFMAHDRMIRVEINPSGPGMLKWCLWKRHVRKGRIYERHPSISTALEIYRKSYSKLECSPNE